MNWLRALGGAAVLWITTVLGVVAASLFVSNELFRGSGYGRAVAVTVVALAVCLLVGVAIGRPDRSWARTPYW
jgi:hypothetical protein